VNTATGEIDKAIRSLPLQTRWKSIEQAISFGRHVLHVALEDASLSKGHRRADQYEYFQVAADLTTKVHQELQNLLNHIGPSGLKGRQDFPPVRVSKSLVKSGVVVMREARRKATGDIVDPKKEVETLAGACSLLGEMHRYASSQPSKLQHTRKNEPDYAKRAFVYRLAEGWIFLTGKRPGGGRDTASNPFLRFVDAAALDAGEFEAAEDFYSALKWVLEELKRHERFDVEGKTQQSISGIATHGPAWRE
jgi:hypothetical protein